MARSAQKAAFIRVESTYATDPDNDGSDYTWMPTFSIGEIPNGLTQLETNYMTGRGTPTAPIVGPDGGSIEIVTPVIGLGTAGEDGESASQQTDDWYDDCWENHVTDTATEREGEAVLSATGSTITFDASVTDLTTRDLIAVYDSSSAALAVRSQICQLASGSGAGPWTVAPTFTNNLSSSPTAASVAYGGRHYIWSPTIVGGNSRALVIRDSDVGSSDDVGTYLCLGGRITSRSIVGEAGGRWEDRMTWSFDSITEDASDKSSLPSVGIAPSVTPTVCMLSPVWFNGTAYSTRRIEINFNIESPAIAATAGANGRSGWDIVACNPTVTIEPLATDDLRELKRDITTGQLLVQIGAGILDSGAEYINCCAFHAQSAYVMEADRNDEGGRSRQSVTFKVVEPGIFSGSTFGRFWQFVRF